MNTRMRMSKPVVPVLCLLLGLSSISHAQRMDNSGPERQVPLSQVVSMVQERFNATAVKTDTVMEEGQVVYRIRLLSADKSRVWTVNVDARTGRIY